MRAPHVSLSGLEGDIRLQAYEVDVSVNHQLVHWNMLLSFMVAGDCEAELTWHIPVPVTGALINVELQIDGQGYKPHVFVATSDMAAVEMVEFGESIDFYSIDGHNRGGWCIEGVRLKPGQTAQLRFQIVDLAVWQDSRLKLWIPATIVPQVDRFPNLDFSLGSVPAYAWRANACAEIAISATNSLTLVPGARLASMADSSSAHAYTSKKFVPDTDLECECILSEPADQPKVVLSELESPLDGLEKDAALHVVSPQKNGMVASDREIHIVFDNSPYLSLNQLILAAQQFVSQLHILPPQSDLHVTQLADGAYKYGPVNLSAEGLSGGLLNFLLQHPVSPTYEASKNQMIELVQKIERDTAAGCAVDIVIMTSDLSCCRELLASLNAHQGVRFFILIKDGYEDEALVRLVAETGGEVEYVERESSWSDALSRTLIRCRSQCERVHYKQRTEMQSKALCFWPGESVTHLISTSPGENECGHVAQQLHSDVFRRQPSNALKHLIFSKGVSSWLDDVQTARHCVTEQIILDGPTCNVLIAEKDQDTVERHKAEVLGRIQQGWRGYRRYALKSRRTPEKITGQNENDHTRPTCGLPHRFADDDMGYLNESFYELSFKMPSGRDIGPLPILNRFMQVCCNELNAGVCPEQVVSHREKDWQTLLKTPGDALSLQCKAELDTDVACAKTLFYLTFDDRKNRQKLHPQYRSDVRVHVEDLSLSIRTINVVRLLALSE